LIAAGHERGRLVGRKGIQIGSQLYLAMPSVFAVAALRFIIDELSNPLGSSLSAAS
jgi:hypothetical protein